jgi:molybdenum cofactor cytidylyltransferase
MADGRELMAERFVSGVILAAGRSSRLGRPKQLLDLSGKPVLAHVLDNARAAGLREVILVLGHEADRIQIAVAAHLDGVYVVVNPDYAAGQSTSLRAGIAVLPSTTDAAVFLLGDQPEVGSDIVLALVDAFRASNAPIVVPAYGGRPSNPILIARQVFPALEAVTGDRGARDVVLARWDEVHFVPFPDRVPPEDIDTEDDYAALLARWPENA